MIQHLAPQLASFALDGGDLFEVDMLSDAWPSFTSLQALTLTFAGGWSFTFHHSLTPTIIRDVLPILNALPTELRSLRFLPPSNAANPSLTPILVATRACPKSLSNLKTLTIPMVDSWSEDRDELLRIWDEKGVKVEELTVRQFTDSMGYWEELALAWSVSLYLPWIRAC